MALKEEEVFVTSGKKKANVRKETNAVSGMRVTIVYKNLITMPPHLLSHPCHEVEVCRREEVSKAKVTMVPFSDNRADSIWKVLARDRLVNIGILPSVNFTKPKRVAKPEISVCSRIKRLVNNQKKGYCSHKRRESDDRNAVAVVKFVPQLGCVSQDSDALVSQRGKQPRGNPMQEVLGSIRKVRLTLSTLRQASIQEKKGPSLGKIQVKNPHQRSPNAMTFEDRSHEETERQQRCARSKAWNLAKNMYKLKENDKATFHLPAEEWVLPAASTKEPEEREFAVDSGTSAHMVSKRDLDSAELETMRTSRSLTTVMTANGEVQTREEATENVKVVTVMLLEETPAVLSLGKLCEDHGCIHHWTSNQKPHLTKKVNRIDCNTSNYVPFVIPDLSTSSSTTPTPTSSSSSSQDSVFWRLQVHRKSSTRRKWKYEWGASGRPTAWTHRNRKQK